MSVTLCLRGGLLAAILLRAALHALRILYARSHRIFFKCWQVGVAQNLGHSDWEMGGLGLSVPSLAGSWRTLVHIWAASWLFLSPLFPVGKSWAADVLKPAFVLAQAEIAKQMRTASASSKSPTAQRMVMVRSAVSSWQSWADCKLCCHWVQVSPQHLCCGDGVVLCMGLRQEGSGSINLKNQLAFTKQHLINWVCTFSCTAACVRSALPAVAGGDVYLPPSRKKAGTL